MRVIFINRRDSFNNEDKMLMCLSYSSFIRYVPSGVTDPSSQRLVSIGIHVCRIWPSKISILWAGVVVNSKMTSFSSADIKHYEIDVVLITDSPYRLISRAQIGSITPVRAQFGVQLSVELVVYRYGLPIFALMSGSRFHYLGHLS